MKMDYWHFIKIKSFAQPLKQSTKLKGSIWNGRIFVNDISDKGLIYKIIKNLYNSTPPPKKFD